MSKKTFVVVGAGQAGGWAVSTLRSEGFDGRIVLFGEEAHAPYERPPLSKEVLSNNASSAKPTLFSSEALSELDVEFIANCSVSRIHPEQQIVETLSGHELGFDALLLCTGGRALIPPFPGADSRDMLCLRTLDDAYRLKERLAKPRQHVVIVGAGWIGLEAAAAARSLGHDVTVVEMSERVCSRSVMPEVSEQLVQLHNEQGTQFLFNTQVNAIEPVPAGGSRVVLASGQTLQADTIILGAGLVANDELARNAGLQCNHQGVLVNESCQTSSPNIYAAGDVAVIQSPHTSAPCRLESWQNAQDQGAAAARAMLGQQVSYQPMPLVWSEQYDSMIQIAGHPQLTQKTVTRKSPASNRTIFFGLNTHSQVVAIVGLNAGRDYRSARKLVESKTRVNPEILANAEASLNDAVITD